MYAHIRLKVRSWRFCCELYTCGLYKSGDSAVGPNGAIERGGSAGVDLSLSLDSSCFPLRVFALGESMAREQVIDIRVFKLVCKVVAKMEFSGVKRDDL